MWIALASVSFLLFISVLHMSGALAGVEESIYQGTKNVPVIGAVTKGFHKDPLAGYTDEGKIEVKDLIRDHIATVRKMESFSGEIKKIDAASGQIDELNQKIAQLEKQLKTPKKPVDEEELEETSAGAASGVAPAAGGAQGALVASTPQMTITSAKGTDYKVVSKILEKVPVETAVEILNNLTDDEKVNVLSGMKDKTVADIMGALDPAKAAEIARALARAKSK